MSDWRPIETAPKTSKAILVWVPENKCTFAVTWLEGGDECEQGWCIWGGGSRDFLVRQGPTHWMPLPDPPEDD